MCFLDIKVLPPHNNRTSLIRFFMTMSSRPRRTLRAADSSFEIFSDLGFLISISSISYLHLDIKSTMASWTLGGVHVDFFLAYFLNSSSMSSSESTKLWLGSLKYACSLTLLKNVSTESLTTVLSTNWGVGMNVRPFAKTFRSSTDSSRSSGIVTTIVLSSSLLAGLGRNFWSLLRFISLKWVNNFWLRLNTKRFKRGTKEPPSGTFSIGERQTHKKCFI